MPGNPILLGQAGVSSGSVQAAGSKIQTNQFGIARGTVRHQLGDQTGAQNFRPTIGSLYSGGLPQFKGFFVDEPGDVEGAEGGSGYVDVTYAFPDPKFVYFPQQSSDLELRDISILNGTVSVTLSAVPIPHPTIKYRFNDTKRQGALSTYSQSPTNAPTLPSQLFVNVRNFPDPSVRYANAGVAIAQTSPYNVYFALHPKGWLCTKDDSTSVCGGKYFEIEQEWKRYLIYLGWAQTS